MKALLLVLLMVPQVALSAVYMCVDPATGRKTFTDRGCEVAAAREEVRVQATNLNSGSRSRTEQPKVEKAWLSDRDTRRTGRDYSAERRALLEGNATASAGEMLDNDDS